MIDTRKITALAEQKLEGTDLFVVDCTCTPGNEVELTIDSDTSVGIDACAELSRAIEAELDRDAEDFSLTVMSAGIGSELRSLRQYRKLAGKEPQIVEINQRLEQLAAAEQCTYIDLYSHLTAPGSNDLDPAYTNDGLHLLGDAYLVWKEILQPYLK